MASDPWTRMAGTSAPEGPTQWSILLAAKGSHLDGYSENLERLIRMYWKPVYSYLRIQCRRSNEDAKDLTQSFFAEILERSFFSKVDRERGRFRTFLRACLENFVRGRHTAASALKRGGGARVQSLEFIVSEESPLEPADDRTPEEILDREWEMAVLTQAIRALQESYARESREDYFKVFEAYDLAPNGTDSYESLAAKFSLSASDVTNYLAHARRRLREIAEGIVRESVASPTEVPDEMAQLFPPG